MNTPNQRYVYDEEKISEYLKRKDKFNLRLSVVWWEWVAKETIRKDVCDIKRKQTELEASDSGKKSFKIRDIYDIILWSSDRKFISWYYNLILTILISLNPPKYKEQKVNVSSNIVQNFDYKTMLENKLWKPFIYKLDYLVKKHILDIGYQLLTVEYIIKLINEWKIDDIKVTIDEETEEIIKRFSMDRYNGAWELKY